MSLIENAQKPKQYNEQQDHGNAAEQKGHHKATFDDELQRKTFAKDEEDQFKKALEEAQAKYSSMSSSALEAEADKILNDNVNTEDQEDTYKLMNEFMNNEDGFAKESELGLKSRGEIVKEMARRATLDPGYDEDDLGDSDFTSPIRVKTRL